MSNAQRARASIGRWVTGIVVAWVAEGIAYAIVAGRGRYPLGELFIMSLFNVVGIAIIAPIVAGLFVASLIGLYYLIVRSRQGAKFPGWQTPWSSVYRRALVIGAVIGIFLGQDHSLRSGTPVAVDTSISSPAPTPMPSPTVMLPTRADLSATIHEIFKRGQQGGSKRSDVPVLSPAFLASAVSARRIMELFGADHVEPRIDDIRGRVADVTETYVLTSDKKAQLHFTRHDTWAFVHGSGHWLLDTISINDKSLTRIDYPDSPSQAISDSKYESDTGRIRFSIGGINLAWTPQKNMGWKVDVLSIPAIAPTLPPLPSGATAVQPEVQSTPSTATDAPVQNPVVADPYGDCTQESIESVSEDGAVVKLLDGRRFLIQESERYLTSIWLATDDVTVCDPGPGASAKLIHEDDVVYAGHLE